MDIIEAINQRKSIRAFKTDPVSRETLTKIIDLALLAPSWGNTQPWEFAIVTGEKLEEIRRACIERAEEEPTPDVARPRGFPEPYGTRRSAMAAKFLEIKGIRREDREGRGWWRLRGLRHFESPAVIYICVDRAFYYQDDAINAWPLFDFGLIAENIMLLATRYSLGTIAQAQAVLFPDVVRRILGMPESKLIVLGIAIGYPDWNDPINGFRSEREPVNKVTRWYGFD